MIRIVIIEDQPIILEGIKVLINQTSDFEVIGEFKNGKEFLNAFQELEFDIVLTDIDMPVLNGISTTKEVLAINPNIKVIALSMYNDHQYYLEMIMAGAKGFVLKQASVQELEKAIREVCKNELYFSNELLQSVIIDLHQEKNKKVINDQMPENISPREKELLQNICKGMSNKELADNLILSVKTIESYKAKLMQKTKTKNTAGLIIWAIKNKIVEV